MKYTDAHCHITAPLCDSNIIARICNATNEDDWEKLIKIANADTHVCIGIHPWYIQMATDGWDERMYKILQSNPHIMIGEIGMDKYHPNIDKQIELFTTQLEIAAELGRPVHLHIVGAWDKLLHILEKYKKLPPIIVHGFNGNSDIMTQVANRDIYFSYKLHNSRISDTARIAAATKILVESDCDTCGPQLQILADTTREIAKMRGTPVAELNEQINQNFQRIINYV